MKTKSYSEYWELWKRLAKFEPLEATWLYDRRKRYPVFPDQTRCCFVEWLRFKNGFSQDVKMTSKTKQMQTSWFLFREIGGTLIVKGFELWFIIDWLMFKKELKRDVNFGGQYREKNKWI